MCSLFPFLVLFIFCLNYVNGDRVKSKMYEQINSAAACFRRLNATHQIGCSSNRKANTGVIHMVNNQTDIQWLIENGKAGPYILVMPTNLFNQINVELFEQHPTLISGLVLTPASSRPESYSHESTCPNQYSQLNGTCNEEYGWNLFGTNLLHKDFVFPIFLLQNETEIEKIRHYFVKFNLEDFENQHERPLSSIELNSFMIAAVNTETCTRRSNLVGKFSTVKFCDPLGDKNIWTTLKPRNTDTLKLDKLKYIMIATHIDTVTMFDGVTPGASNPISSLVTYISTAYMLKKMLGNTFDNLNYNILFSIFNGESFDYIGSQKMVYDMEHSNFPVKQNDSLKKYRGGDNIELADIDFIIEISQISNMDAIHVFHLDYDNVKSNEKIENFITKLFDNRQNLIIVEDKSKKIPPSSLQTFLKNKIGKNIPGVVLADHDKNYMNKYYNSIYDDQINLKYNYYNKSLNENGNKLIPSDAIQHYLSNVSFTLAKTLFSELVNANYTGLEFSTATLIDELIYCFLITPNCKIFNTLIGYGENENGNDSIVNDKPLNMYVGVNVWYNTLTTLTGYTLGLLTGQIIENRSEHNCTTLDSSGMYSYIWLRKDKWYKELFQIKDVVKATNESKFMCIRTILNFTKAISPAFEIEDYDWKSGQYSTWSESVWREMSVRIFLKPPEWQENLALILGLITLFVSFIVTYFIHQKSTILFYSNDSTFPEREW